MEQHASPSYYMRAKHRRTLEAVFRVPTRGGILFSDLEALIAALGGDAPEGSGSRIVFELKGSRQYLHRPHPGKEAKKYQVEELREWLRQLEVTP
jgi:HicA toxin of bacterial toxin-antitoxin,